MRCNNDIIIHLSTRIQSQSKIFCSLFKKWANQTFLPTFWKVGQSKNFPYTVWRLSLQEGVYNMNIYPGFLTIRVLKCVTMFVLALIWSRIESGIYWMLFTCRSMDDILPFFFPGAQISILGQEKHWKMGYWGHWVQILDHNWGHMEAAMASEAIITAIPGNMHLDANWGCFLQIWGHIWPPRPPKWLF